MRLLGDRVSRRTAGKIAQVRDQPAVWDVLATGAIVVGHPNDYVPTWRV